MRRFCPCCGQEWAIDDLPKLRGPRRNRIIEIVSRRPGLDMHRLADLVYADDINGGPDDAAMVVRVTIAHMNKQLRRQGWRIAADRCGYGGYRLSRIS